MEKGPEPLGEILSRLFAARGWGRRNGRLRLEQVWANVAGPDVVSHTRVGTLRRGVLEVLVDSGVLMQELTGFRKRKLLEQLQEQLPGALLKDVRFRAGVW